MDQTQQYKNDLATDQERYQFPCFIYNPVQKPVGQTETFCECIHIQSPTPRLIAQSTDKRSLVTVGDLFYPAYLVFGISCIWAPAPVRFGLWKYYRPRPKRAYNTTASQVIAHLITFAKNSYWLNIKGDLFSIALNLKNFTRHRKIRISRFSVIEDA